MNWAPGPGGTTVAVPVAVQVVEVVLGLVVFEEVEVFEGMTGLLSG